MHFGHEDEAADDAPRAFSSRARTGARDRFIARARKWQLNQGRLGQIRHMGWWWFHNLVAHLAIGLFWWTKWAHRLHDWSSYKLNNPTRPI